MGIVLISMLISACGVTGRMGNSNTGDAVETGMASWYGPNFHGNRTANGEVYDMDGFTAAHRTLPFNTVVRVLNLDNGKSTVVRINDRGPFAKNRIIDLSRRAASEIGMIGPGTAHVRLYILEGDLAVARNRDLKVATYTIQLGSFRGEREAEIHSGRISGSRVEKAYLANGDDIYRVYYGQYTNPEIADRDRLRLLADGYDGYVKQLEN